MENEFNELIATNPPRLVVEFERGSGGEEQFRWGVVGNLPVLTLVGYLVHVRVVLATNRADDGTLDLHPSRYCEPSALVVVLDARSKSMRFFINGCIPPDSMVGMLEVVSALLVDSRLAQQSMQQTRIVDAGGNPIRRTL